MLDKRRNNIRDILVRFNKAAKAFGLGSPIIDVNLSEENSEARRVEEKARGTFSCVKSGRQSWGGANFLVVGALNGA